MNNNEQKPNDPKQPGLHKAGVIGSLRVVMELIQKLNEMDYYMINNKDFTEDEFIEISRALRGAKQPLKEWCARNDS